MLRPRHWAIALILLTAACTSRDTTNADGDLGKMDAELEARARDIETKADEAASAVERAAQAEINRVERAAREQSADAAPPAADEAK